MDYLMELRAFQTKGIERIDTHIASGRRRVLGVAPTGAGKTIIACKLISRQRDSGRRSMFLAPRRELISQTSQKLDEFGVSHGIIQAGDPRRNLFSLVQVASVDTLRARRDRMVIPDPDLVIVDEAHLFITQIRLALISQWPHATILGLTATPCRRDGRGLGTFFEEMVEIETVANLTAGGYLAPARYFSIDTPALEHIRTVAGDYAQNQLEAAVAPLVADIPTTFLERAPGRRAVVFAVSVSHSVALQHAFLSHGVAAEHVDGGTPSDERDAIFARFKSGTTQVLTNCNLASYGFDLPALDCVILARPTKSLALFLQMIGRGLRAAPGKPDCLVLDHAGNVHQHGFAADPRAWSLDGHTSIQSSERKSAGKPSIEKHMNCPTCKAVFSGSRVCPSCGFYFAPKAKEIRTIEGELVELGERVRDADADRAVFYLELRGFANERGYRDGWAAFKFKEKHGDMPPWSWKALPPAAPSLETRRWIQSRNIARAKAGAA